MTSRQQLSTSPGLPALIIVGDAVGACFAALVLTLTVVSFPMLIDRNVGVGTAVATSVRAVTTNPVTQRSCRNPHRPASSSEKGSGEPRLTRVAARTRPAIASSVMPCQLGARKPPETAPIGKAVQTQPSART